jgi:hypothetical protein
MLFAKLKALLRQAAEHSAAAFRTEAASCSIDFPPKNAGITSLTPVTP